MTSLIAKFMGPLWGPPGSCRPQMGPMLAPWTLLSGLYPNIAITGVTTSSNVKKYLHKNVTFVYKESMHTQLQGYKCRSHKNGEAICFPTIFFTKTKTADCNCFVEISPHLLSHRVTILTVSLRSTYQKSSRIASIVSRGPGRHRAYFICCVNWFTLPASCDDIYQWQCRYRSSNISIQRTKLTEMSQTRFRRMFGDEDKPNWHLCKLELFKPFVMILKIDVHKMYLPVKNEYKSTPIIHIWNIVTILQ